MTVNLRSGFSLALGGGGGRGWAHIGVARALDEAGLRPGLVVGTSSGAIVGAGIAAGVTPREMERLAGEISVSRSLGRGAHLALLDPRPVLEHLRVILGDPLIEDLPLPLAVSAYDLVAGRPAAITHGPLIDALERSIAVPLLFPPTAVGGGVWCDAGPWEAVPISLARSLSSAPVIGVLIDVSKPALLAAPPVAALLRRVGSRLGTGSSTDALTARRYLALLATRWADPVHVETPDLLIKPRLGLTQGWQFARVGRMVELGYRGASAALVEAGLRTERHVA
ncbi:MAG: patatin-like phospholipase family protein [Chloroflexota bacterium]